jgi:hypothetical protein
VPTCIFGDVRDSCGVTVSQGANTAVSVAFSPTAAFPRLATLLIEGNAFDAPVFVPLSGNGLAQADLAVGLTASTNRVKNGSKSYLHDHG